MTRASGTTRRELARSTAGLEELMRAAEATQAGAFAASTLRKYGAAFRRWQAWCFTQNVKPLPAAGDVLSAYLEGLSETLTLASVQLELAAIAKAHVLCRLENPRFSPPVRAWLAGFRRRNTRLVKKARPLSPLEVWKCVDAIADHATGVRDRALLLVGYATGLRESELVGLDVEDLERAGSGWLARIRVSKTDPTRLGLTAGIPRLPGRVCCPAAALEVYLLENQVVAGPVFRGAWKGGRLRSTRLHVSAVDAIVRNAARAARLPVEGLSGHSLRRGIATAASEAGCTLQEVADAMRHRSLTTALGYIGDREVLKAHVLRKISIG